MKREFSAGGIVIRRRGRGLKVLLIKDSYGRWTWPKGNIEKGESSKEAALREVSEETGLTNISIIDKIGQNQYFYKLKGKLIFKTVYVYLIEAAGNEKLRIQKEEIDDGKWLAPEQALKKLGYKDAPKLLKKAILRYKKGVKK
jgi:8-oxo-dGTP diphosphatase